MNGIIPPPEFWPLFAAAFAVQQLLEILTSILDVDSNPSFQKYKKPILGVVSLAVGFILAGTVGRLRVLAALGANSAPEWIDIPITALVLSAGTEGVNSILKFLKYAKEDKKNAAASKDPSNTGAAASLSAPVPAGIASPAALQKMNRQ
jgi:hypothetical protein